MKPYKPGLPLVTEFEDLIDSLPGRIKVAKLNTRQVCQVAGIPRPTYYKQLKARSFTAGEVKTLLRTIAKLQRRFKVAVEPEPEPDIDIDEIDLDQVLNDAALTPEEDFAFRCQIEYRTDELQKRLVLEVLADILAKRKKITDEKR